MKKRKALIEIYCKIGAENFPFPPWKSWNGKKEIIEPCTGNELFDFLMGDAGQAYDYEAINSNPYITAKEVEALRFEGDRAIWYLCCNEKHGYLTCDEHTKIGWRWGGRPEIVIIWLNSIYKHKIITKVQFVRLVKEVKFAYKTFSIHYDIPDYFVHKRDFPNEPWIKSNATKEECDKFHKSTNE